jgi:hypothetical protein
MDDQARKYKGYDIIPVKDPTGKRVIGYDVPMLSPPKLFPSVEEAKKAIDRRIEKLQKQYGG